ncbi:protein O-linked-mannose beta-1,4-N-acetylglucosaminyltransferase 2-like [Panicum miliaceum]|uniref:Protein O-linked-mannose beta-1,4-N-acetylglucosaminyltransferase 2-like n=1 Tax=Panicum miliaceum TaxID=4540 RepID=A0A3L6SM79_PANMI|nr:protein O-linked-mannose beta-1,4-N-acetylglucosaminyltransferase 2-like [Panicum miliaceum]
MAASKLAVPKGLGAVEDAAAAKNNRPRWGFVQCFFVLSVVLCVLLYAPRVFVLAPRGIDVVGSFTPNSSSKATSSSSGSPVRETYDGGRLVLDNQVHSPCSSMRDHTICCDRSSVHTDVCFMAGDVRTDAASLSLLLFPPHDHYHQHQAPPNGSTSSTEERVRPYPRKWERLIMAKVPEVRLRVARPEEEAAAEHRCDVHHDAPLLVMSAGGYTGNLFHAFNDGFLPSWLTVQHLRRRVVLGVLSYNPWWAGTFSEIISGLSDYHVVDLVHDKRTHCFPGAIVGTRFHGVLVVDPARLRDNKTIVDFHQLLADALGIVSRKGTRVIENQAAVARLASSIGFDVDVLETATGLPLSAWYASVSACDALVGVHGADLTKFLFLRPGRASLTQIAPLGVSAIARDCFGGPAARMGVAYEQYEVGGEESSLARRYAADDVVVADPERAKREKGGWGLVARVYLGGQNVSLDLGRFGETLARLHSHALLLRRRR